jgi:hypothetical protein
MFKLNIDFKEAFAFVKEKYPKVKPNTNFINQLNRFTPFDI